MSKMSNMNGIKGIIETHRARLEASGLMRQVVASPLPPHISQIVSPHARALAVLRECPDRLRVQASPMSMLFDYTLPKLEPMLAELGEARAEQIVNKLCEHGKAMIEKHGIDGSKEHLDGLFGDLPAFGRIYLENGGVEEIIETYRQYDEEGTVTDLFFSKRLWDKINMRTVDDQGMFVVGLRETANDQDLSRMRKARNISELNLNNTQVSDLTPLMGQNNMKKIYLKGAPVSDEQVEAIKQAIPGLQVIR